HFTPDFDPEMFKGRAPINVSGVRKQFGKRVVLDEVSFTLSPQSRIALVGANGSGKSTVLRLLAGRETPDAGEIMISPQVRLGYLDQEAAEFAPHQTLFEA